jgi:hypothetical protein
MHKCYVLLMIGQRHFPRRMEIKIITHSFFLFDRYGVPNVLVMDGAKAQVQGDFRQVLRAAGCHIKQTDNFTSKTNLGEGGVHEFKRGVG